MPMEGRMWPESVVLPSTSTCHDLRLLGGGLQPSVDELIPDAAVEGFR